MIQHLRFILLLALLVSRTLDAQSQSNASTFDEDDQAHTEFKSYTHFALRLMPSGLLNRYFSGLPIGASFSPIRQISIVAEVTIPFNHPPYFKATSSQKSNYKAHYKYRGEFRYNIEYSPRVLYFVSAEVFTKKESFHIENGQVYDSQEIRNCTRADVTKTVIGGAFMFGNLLHVTSNLCIEITCGLGIKEVGIQRVNDVYNRSGTEKRHLGSIPNEDEVDSKRNLCYFPASIGITYGFGRFKR